VLASEAEPMRSRALPNFSAMQESLSSGSTPALKFSLALHDHDGRPFVPR